MIFALISITLALLSLALNLWQWMLGRAFPMHQRRAAPGFSPPLSLLKPLKDCDSETESCLESWFLQDYPGEFEILFAVASPDDPVCPIVRRVMAKFPNRAADLIIAHPVLGPNGKVSSLCYLTKKARYEHLVISDADVHVKSDFLSEIIVQMRDESVALVNSFYILAAPKNFAMRLEAVAVNADFWSQVLQSLSLRPMDFALGASMVTTRRALADVGGYEALLELLADDYHLGNRLVKTGRKLVICPVPVECRTAELSWEHVWTHQLRWARTIRVCQPVGYFFSILSNGTLWPLLAINSFGSAGRWLFVIAMVVRMLGAVSNYERLTGERKWSVAFDAIAKDVAHVWLWVLSYTGRAVVWHGQRFKVSPGGKLTPEA